MLSFIIKQKILTYSLVLVLGIVASQFWFAPKALADKPGPNSPAWANAAECGDCGTAQWKDPGHFELSTDVGVFGSNQVDYDFYFDAIATESVGKIVFRENNGQGYAVFEYGEYGKPTFVQDVNKGGGYKPSFTISDDAQAQNNDKRPQAGGGKEYCSLKYDYSQRDCIDRPTGKKPDFTDAQWENIKSIVESGNEANDAGKDCGDDSTLSFITCPVFNMVNKSISKLIGEGGDSSTGKGLLIDLFYVSPLSFERNVDAQGQDANSLYTAWESMRNIALALYVVIFLVVIFGNSLSLGIDAYTIKKTLPRLIGAAILTQFSFLILSVLIDISNVVGIALPGFLLAQGPATFKLTLGGASGWAAAGVAFLLVLILAIMALFSIIVAVITIVGRQLVIFALIITAPLAFACWVLPNTQGLWKKWWSNLWRILAMFPIATGIIASAILFSRVIGHQEGVGDITQLAGALAPLIALAILPKTFKWGGDFVNAATGAAVGFAAGRKDWAKGKGKDLGKKGYGTARDRVALNAPENARFRHLISGGGFRNSSHKNMIKRGQNKGRILGEYDKAAQYAERDQLRLLAGSKNKGMQMAAIGRMAKTGDLEGLTGALASGQVTRGTYKAAVGQYYGDFDKMPQMRSVAFADDKSDSSRAVMTTVPDGKGGTTQRPAIEKSFHDGMTGESLAGASTDSKKHIMGSGEIPASAVNQILSTPALEAKFSSEDINALRGAIGAAGGAGATGGTAPAVGSPAAPIIINSPSTAPGSNSDVVAELKRIGNKLGDGGGAPPPAPGHTSDGLNTNDFLDD